MKFKTTIAGFLLMISWLNGQAQIEEKEDIQESFLKESNILEDIVEDSDEGNFENNTAYEYLAYFLEKPLSLNKASAEDFRELGIISEQSIQALLNYREQYGDLLSVAELQAITEIPFEEVRRLSPFVDVEAGNERVLTPIPQMLLKGKNEIFLRSSRTFPDREGFKITDTLRSRYLGDPNQLYFRFKHSFERNLSYGITAEKDAGEEFFKGSNDRGFDFYSYHFYLRNYRKWLKTVAVGDYVISLGQGLIHYDGFAAGKSSFTTSLKRSGRRLKAFTSVNEAFFLRGGAAEFNIKDDIHLLVFGSYRKIDANVINPIDTGTIDEEINQFSSFQVSGLHRTPSEIEDKNSLTKTTAGASLGLKKRNWHINVNAVYNSLDKEALPGSQLYQKFNFQGDQLLNIGLDYSYVWKNFHLFGELASSDNGAIAMINGLNFTPSRDFDIALLHRSFPRDYQNFASSVFSETRTAQNEYGWYLGMEYRFSKEIKLNAYLDQWRHPWLRFGVDAPSSGNEQFIRLTYYKKRKYTCYLQLLNENKQKNLPTALETEPLDVLAWQKRTQVRVHFQNKISKTLELRNRIEFSYYDIGGQAISRGYLIYQDVIFKPLDFPLSFSSRFALFDTDDYNSRIYAYENDVLYYFSIPPYFNQGQRFYLNLRYRPVKNYTFELRYAITKFNDVESISSGLNEIEGNKRHDLRAQIKIAF